MEEVFVFFSKRKCGKENCLQFLAGNCCFGGMSIFVLYLLVCEVKVLDDCPVKLYLKIIKKVYS